MRRLILTIDADNFGDRIASKLSRALRNAASKIEHGAFETGHTFEFSVDGEVVGQYRFDDQQGTMADRFRANISNEVAMMGPISLDRLRELARQVGAHNVVKHAPEKVIDNADLISGEASLTFVFMDGSKFDTLRNEII